MFEKLRKDKISFYFLIIIIVLGIFLRVNDYSENTFWSDDGATVPGAVYWFYPPYEYFPGLLTNGAPPLGHFLIGLGCSMSGEDFSEVRNISPYMYPGRAALLGDELSKAEHYCHFPVYAFGILFLLMIALLSLTLLNVRSAVFMTAFFAFFQPALFFSRFIKADVMLWFFIAASYFFLWRGYNAEKGSRMELNNFVFSAFLIGLAQATKWYGGLFLVVFGLVFLDKYLHESLSMVKNLLRNLNLKFVEKIKEVKNLKNFYKNLAVCAFAFLLPVLAAFKFSFKTLIETYNAYKSTNPAFVTPRAESGTLTALFGNIASFNLLDLLVLLFGLYILYKILRSRKGKLEKFILYQMLLYIILAFVFSISIDITRIALPFMFGLLIVMSLSFSDKSYSVFETFKIKNKNMVFGIFMVVYIILGFYLAFNESPYFTEMNPLLCRINNERCGQEHNLYNYAARETVVYLESVMRENETFIPAGMWNYYIRQEDDLLHHLFLVEFEKQAGREATLQDFILYYMPNGRAVRYVLVNPEEKNEMFEELKKFEPYHKIKLNEEDAVWVYKIN